MRHPNHPRQHRNAGVSLLFALLSLVALTVAAVALVKSIDTGALVLGNLGLKQDASAVSDQAANQAINWLNAHSGSLTADAPGSGYYATANEDLDVTGQQVANDGTPRALVNWNMDECAYAADIQHATCKLQPSDQFELNGNQVRYVILRLCDTVGDRQVSGNSCAQPLNTGSGKASTRAAGDYASMWHVPPGGGIYYRIVVRVVGARKTTSYVETIVHL